MVELMVNATAESYIGRYWWEFVFVKLHNTKTIQSSKLFWKREIFHGMIDMCSEIPRWIIRGELCHYHGLWLSVPRQRQS